MKRVAVIQSNYIPWKGYFDIIHDAELFLFYDDVQFTRQDWRTRNRIKTANGVTWLSIPAGTKLDRLICEVELVDAHWQQKHWRTISQAYARAPFFSKYKEFFEDVYLQRRWANLSDLNQFLTKHIAREFLGITTQFRDSREYGAQGSKQDRLLDLLLRAGADTYVSGPSARGYIDAARFHEAGITLVWKSYDGYPAYAQPHPPFEHGVSVLDLLFSVGPDAPYYIWGWRERSQETE